MSDEEVQEDGEENRALVGNAADPKQVSDARKKKKLLRDNELNDIRLVMSTGHGRRFISRILERCLFLDPIWHPQSEYVHYRAGKQDVGCFIKNEIVEANEALFFQMMKESKRQ